MTTQKQNIFLVTIDSLRADHCGFMGYDRDTTPVLDTLASNGITFKNAISPGPATPQSTPAMFTGSYPESGKSLTEGSAMGRLERIRSHMQRQQTIGERLREYGYRTAAFTPNPWTSRYFNFDQGYDYFRDFMDSDRSSSLWEIMLEGHGSMPITAIRLIASWIQRENTFRPWESFIDDVLEWIHRGDGPFFVWVFLLDTHFPYLTGRGHRTQSRWRTYEANLRLYLENQDSTYSDRIHEQLERAYDDAIRYTDDFLAEITDRLVSDDTSLLVTSDHGEAFGEHDTYGHHDSLYEENIHVPLVVTGGPEATIEKPISLRMLPHLVTQIAERNWKAVEGIGAPIAGSRTEDNSVVTIRGKDWKYIESESGEDEMKYLGGMGTKSLDDDVLEGLGENLLARWKVTLENQKKLSDIVGDVANARFQELGGVSK